MEYNYENLAKEMKRVWQMGKVLILPVMIRKLDMRNEENSAVVLFGIIPVRM
jgi:hypothetical protein